MNLDLGDTALIRQVARKYALTRQQTAYVLATVYWETDKTMKPVREAYWLSEEWRKNNLRYYPWYGRGYVQLTWRENYKRAQNKLNLGTKLTDDPDNAMKAEYAVEILVRGMMEGWFTGKALTRYINGNKVDYLNARRVVNLMDKAGTIKNLAEDYEEALKVAKPIKTKSRRSLVDIVKALLKALGFIK